MVACEVNMHISGWLFPYVPNFSLNLCSALSFMKYHTFDGDLTHISIEYLGGFSLDCEYGKFVYSCQSAYFF